jgi:hypothetical protein
VAVGRAPARPDHRRAARLHAPTQWICGWAANALELAGRFDAVFLLEIDQQTMRTRIGDPRRGNDFGTAGDSLAVALAWHTPIVAAWRRHGAVTIDATRAVDTVAEELLIAAGLAVLRRHPHDT